MRTSRKSRRRMRRHVSVTNASRFLAYLPVGGEGATGSETMKVDLESEAAALLVVAAVAAVGFAMIAVTTFISGTWG